MPECNQKTPLCQCIDWKTGDLAVGVNHLMNHFEFQRFELEYSTLEPEENRRLCKIGRCLICGKRLCYGTELYAQDSGDRLLTKIYHWVFQMWDSGRECLPDGINCFRDMVLSLFHESDQDFVCEWLNHRAGSDRQASQEGT